MNNEHIDLILKYAELEQARLKLETELGAMRDFFITKMAEHLSRDFQEHPDDPDPDRPWTLIFDMGDLNYMLTGKRETE